MKKYTYVIDDFLIFVYNSYELLIIKKLVENINSKGNLCLKDQGKTNCEYDSNVGMPWNDEGREERWLKRMSEKVKISKTLFVDSNVPYQKRVLLEKQEKENTMKSLV